MRQEEYMYKVAETNYNRFYKQGFATAGHNGPHGHIDTPVRNTSHYLIIYSYLYKKTKDKKYIMICEKFVDYLINVQISSKSGAMHCMISDSFDHLNGLIGQGWVIEALLYYYEIFKDEKCLNTAKSIFYSQKYDWKLHLWHRIELDGSDIGIDPTYNHHVWFAASSYKLADFCKDDLIDKIIRDFLLYGSERDFQVYQNDGLLKHHVNLNTQILNVVKWKRFIKKILTPISFFNSRKFDFKYMEYAYHIFDLYGFCILKEKYGDLPLFSSKKYIEAEACAKNINYLNRKNGIDRYINYGKPFNVYSYSYNSLCFEYPFVVKKCRFNNPSIVDRLFDIQTKLMWDDTTGMFTKNQPDIETWNARTYEIIRYLES